MKQTAGLALVSCAPEARGRSAPESLANPVGYATISWPDSKIEHALDTISNLGFKGVQMLGFVREVYRGARAEEERR